MKTFIQICRMWSRKKLIQIEEVEWRLEFHLTTPDEEHGPWEHIDSSYELPI